ncbi:uncharacterized protein LOC144653297 [Oculina patagonica]
MGIILSKRRRRRRSSTPEPSASSEERVSRNDDENESEDEKESEKSQGSDSENEAASQADDESESEPEEKSEKSQGSDSEAKSDDEETGENEPDGRSSRSSSVNSNESETDAWKNVFLGKLDKEMSDNVKIVRIFTSSTFTDTSVERNTLMEKVYPRLKSYCQERGYDFQVVDMRWGVRDESTDDHMTTELCMRELRACQKLSTGPNFITFLGQKYGYRPFPAQISASEFEKLLGAVDNKDDLQLLKHWFWRDDNSVPAQYLLQPIPSLLPDYRNYDNEELRRKASGEWWTAFERMQVVLRMAADKALDEKSERHKYYMSVTEDEIRRGIINASNPSKHCFWFKRVISDLQTNIGSKNAGKFMDKTWGANSSVDETAQKFLNVFRENDLPQALPSTNIMNYDIKWSDNGVDPSASTEHSQYIEKLCTDFYGTLTQMIDNGIQEKEASGARDPIVEEIFQHGSFCQKKCSSFQGRKDFLEAAKNTLVNHDKHSLVVYGASGCGKTSIMAKIAAKVRRWVKGKSAIVVSRFVGTSPDSSAIRPLLRSICIQLCKATEEETEEIPEDMKSLKDYFHECLKESARNQPVILVLDSLDQLSIDDSGRQMDWFPRQLPRNVYTILSTLPGDEYQALPSLRTILPEECFMEVPKIPLDEADVILDTWLKAANRTILPKQKSYVMESFQKCPLPLYLKLSFDEALRWKSYTPESDMNLEPTVREIIDDLFSRVEKRHGKILVSHALAYITASKNGLTEPELEDLLSLDDEVLNDVYQYWTPPVRRLPPLLWIRIRSDIGDYLIERGADGTQVVFWFHRQFIEAARERYLTDEQKKKIHANMSDYFLGKWSGGVKKPFVNKEGKEMSMDRLVPKQPLMFDSRGGKEMYNLRKLSELPFHLLHSGNLEKMREECLCNFEFLLAKLRGTSLQVLMDDFLSYLDVKSKDDDVELLYECLQLSAHPLSQDSNQLPTQLIGRMYNFLQRQEQYPDVHMVLKQALNSSIACFLPTKKCLTAPGGALRSSMALPQYGTNVISIANDNRTIAISSQTSEGLVIRVIDYVSGREMRKFTMTETDLYLTIFCQISQKNPDLLLLAGSHKIFLLNTLTGRIIQEFQVSEDDRFSYDSKAPVSFADDENLLVAICPDALKIWKVENGELLHKLKLKGINTKEELGTLDARGSHAVYSLKGKNTVHIIDVKNGEEVQKINISYPRNKMKKVFVKEIKITSLDQVAVIPSSLDNLRLYDLSGNLIRELTNFKMEEDLHGMQITDDGTKVVTAEEFEICILNLETGEMERCLRFPVYQSHVYTRDGTNILAIGQDNSLRVYDRRREGDDENKKETFLNKIYGYTVSDTISAIQSSFDQRYVLSTAVVKLKNEIDVWDALSGQRVCRLMNLMVFPDPIRMCSASRGVGFIDDKKIPHYKVFNFVEGTIERNLDGKACKRMTAFGFIDQKHMLSFSRGRRFLKVWDVDSGKVVKVVQFKEKHRFEKMLISTNGKMAVCSLAGRKTTNHKDKELPLIAVDTTSFTHKVLKYEGEQLILFNARISDDGKYLVNYVQNSRPLLWDLHSGQLIQKLFDPEENESAITVAVSGASMMAMTGTHDGIKVWSIESGQVLRTISSPDVSNLYLSPDGEVVISKSNSFEADSFHAWDPKTGRKLASFTTDGNVMHVEIVGDRLALGLRENPNLMIVHLHRPGQKGKVHDEYLQSPYDGLTIETTLTKESQLEKPSAQDDMDTDKDDDKGDVAK